MELEVFKKDGTKSGEKVKLSEEIFGVTPNHHLIYRAVRTHLDNLRQGTSRVKTRAEVKGGGKKPFKQKHTGMARQGSSRSPVMVGGGSIFGPKPRDYSNQLPAQMRRNARKSALSIKAAEGQIRIVEDFTFGAPRTKEMVDGAEGPGSGQCQDAPAALQAGCQRGEVRTEYPRIAHRAGGQSLNV